MEAELDSVCSYFPLPPDLLPAHFNPQKPPAHAAGAGAMLPSWVQVSKHNIPMTVL